MEKLLANILNDVHINMNGVQYTASTMTMKINRRALGFGLGAAMVAVCAARVGSSFKLATLAHFHAVVKGGAWADLGVATVGFLLGFVIWRQMVTTHPPTASTTIAVALVTSIAIGFMICAATAVALTLRYRHAVAATSFGFWFAFSWLCFLFTSCLPLIALMAAWAGVWRTICADESSGSASRRVARNIRGRQAAR